MAHFDNGALWDRLSHQSSKAIAASVSLALRRPIFSKVNLVTLVLCGRTMKLGPLGRR